MGVGNMMEGEYAGTRQEEGGGRRAANTQGGIYKGTAPWLRAR